MKLFTFLFSLLFSFLAHSDYQILTDFDDTLKQTHSQDMGDTLKSLTHAREFAGMSELINGLSEAAVAPAPGHEFFLLTGSYKIIQTLVRGFLKKNNYLNPVMMLRGKDDVFEDIYQYKMARLEKIYSRSLTPLVLIGDDVQKDPEVYADFAKRNPGAVKAIYIHVVKGRILPDGASRYHTAFEVALMELVEGRLNVNQVLDVGDRLAAFEKDDVFPSYKLCPRGFVFSADVYQMPPGIQQRAKAIEKKVNEFCG